MASITVRLVDGRNTRASRLCIPQSRLAEPLSVYGCGRAATEGENRPASARVAADGENPPASARPPSAMVPPPSAALLSLSGIVLSFAGAVGGLHFLGPRGPPERFEQAFFRKGEHPGVDLPPGRIALPVGGHGARVGLEHGRPGAQLA